VSTPFRIDPDLVGVVKKVVCGGIHSAILNEEGRLFTFGCGSNGRLGHPEFKGHKYLYKESMPKVVEAFRERNVVDVGSSYYTMIAIV
jgi:alpha-tubulin suppressor-like RCC1 family protein